jgi:inorganic pyrophosphatase
VQKSLMSLPAQDPDTGRVNVIVEAPLGSRVKYKMDASSGLLMMDKVLPPGLEFPFNFGSVPSTCAADGDPIDMVVLMDEPLFPGCLVTVRLLGVIEAEQTQEGRTVRNDRLIGVAERSGSSEEASGTLSERTIEQIENFFVTYNRAQGRTFRPLGRHGSERAEELMRQAVELHHRPTR